MPKGRQSGMPDQASWEAYFEPDALMPALDCPASGDVVEFGCGYGLFSVAAARRSAGVVYALDFEPAMVEATAARAARAGLNNVAAQVRDFLEAGCGRPDAGAAYAMLFNILHVERPEVLLAEAFRVLAPGGRVALMHWKRDAATPRGPTLDIRPRPEHCRAWAEHAGFRYRHHGDLPGCPWHWGMTLERPADPATPPTARG